MRLQFKFPLAIVLVTLTLFSCDPTRRMTEQELAEQKVSTFILVRHAEKDYGDDPLLTAAGTARAERLKEMLTRVDLDAVYSTDTKRTMATARPAAEYHDLKIQEYSPFELTALATRLRTRHRGETVLVVGHSNTTPELTGILDRKGDYPRFSELDYTNFYVISVPPKGRVRVLKLRF
ncbi:MAG: phosphoglycerate mutase family protein [Bacteroidota bacterium]